MKLIITGNLTTALANQVENLDTARAMWEALQNQFEGSGIVLYIQATAKFSTMKSSDYPKLDDFILAYRQTMETLAQFKMKVRDPDAVIFFVEKVKDDYPVWAMNMRTRLRALKEIDDIKISLLDEFVRDLKDESRENHNPAGSQMAMYHQPRENGNSKANSKGKEKSKSNPKTYDCKTCGNPKAKHPQEKCFENPENRNAKLAWEKKNKKSWKPFKGSKSKSNSDSNDSRASFFNDGYVALSDSITVVMAKDKNPSSKSNLWIYDTGAGCHIANSLDKFDEGTYTEIDKLPVINTASGPIRPRGKGTVTLQCIISNDEIVPMKCREVCYLPECPINLLSGVRLYKAGGYASKNSLFGPHNLEIAKFNNAMIINEYIPISALPALERQPPPTLDLWHRRLGHLGVRNVKATKEITTGIKYENNSTEPDGSTLCEACELSKPLRHVRKTTRVKNYKPFDSVSVDVVMITPRGKILLNDSWINVRYCTVFTDAASSTRWGHYHDHKNGAFEAIKNFNAMVSTQFGMVIKSWRLDGGKEFSPSQIGEIASKLGQIVEMTTPYSPEQDGRAERSIGIIVSRVRTVSIEKKIPKFLWPELMRTQMMIANRCATSILHGETPFQFLNRICLKENSVPDLSHLRVLGCKAYVQIPVERRVLSRKLDDRAEIGILLGYEGQHIFRVY
ncbi:hypothetical protein K3495_g14837, partial [Podosphaera aphanis]